MSELCTSAKSQIAVFRQDIVKARIRLACCDVTPAQEWDLWQICESREWFIKTLAACYADELELIDRDLETALRR